MEKIRLEYAKRLGNDLCRCYTKGASLGIIVLRECFLIVLVLHYRSAHCSEQGSISLELHENANIRVYSDFIFSKIADEVGKHDHSLFLP